MAGHSKTRNQRTQQRSSAYVPLPNESDHRYAAAAFYGGASAARDEGSSDLADARREMSRAVKEKAEMSRLATMSQAADAAFNPPQGGDGVSAETMRAASEVLGNIADRAMKGEESARLAATAERDRVDKARQDGERAAQTAAAQSNGVLQTSITSAFAEMGKMVDRLDAAATRAVEAERGRVSDMSNIVTPLMGLMTRLAERGIDPPKPAQTAPQQDSLASLAGTIQALQALGIHVGGHPGESAQDFRLKELTKAQVQQLQEGGPLEKFVVANGGELLGLLRPIAERLMGGAAPAVADAASQAAVQGLGAALDAGGAAI